MVAMEDIDITTNVTMPTQIIEYMKPDVEIRLDFVSAWYINELGHEVIVPLLFYTYPQICSPGLNRAVMKRSVLQIIDEDAIYKRADALQKDLLPGYILTDITFQDNIHTHPKDVRNFSSIDVFGPLRPGYNDSEFRDGVSVIAHYSGELYKAVVRECNEDETECFYHNVALGYDDRFIDYQQYFVNTDHFVNHREAGYLTKILNKIKELF